MVPLVFISRSQITSLYSNLKYTLQQRNDHVLAQQNSDSVSNLTKSNSIPPHYLSNFRNIYRVR